MKKLLQNSVIAGFLLTLLITSCTPSKDVVSDGWLQKRKYNKGFYIDTKGKNVTTPVNKEENMVAEEIVAPSAVEEVKPVVAIDNTNSIAESVAPVAVEKKSTEKNNLFSTKTGLAGKVFEKAGKQMEKSKESYRQYKMSDASSVGAAGFGMSLSRAGEMDKYLKNAIFAAIIGTVMYIIGAIMYAARVAKAVNGEIVTGWGAAGIFYILGYIFWVIATVFFVIWLINKFS
ncbi:MAG: hypothetical protein IT223_11490 [Crocinitomicaceae bacterium]|nr:hypothetical protein [Crocinitomicaceae bacterium]